MAENKKKPEFGEKRLTKLEELFFANLLVWVFLAVLGVVSFFTCGALWDEATSGVMEFLFLVIGGGVALVSVLDYFYDKYTAEPVEEVMN